MFIPLSQRDNCWKNIKIGKSNSTIGNFGCTLTALSILSGTTPDILNQKLTEVGGFQDDKIIWTAINKINLPIKFPDMGRHYSYNNEEVANAISKYKGCLVEVDFDGITSTPNDRHWILYIGNGQAIDPWNGYIVSTSKYPIAKGYCLIEILESNNMTDEQQKILTNIETFYKSNDELKNGNLEGAVNALIGAYKDNIGYKETITNQSKEIEILKNKQSDLDIENSNLKIEIGSLQSEISILNNKLLELQNTEPKIITKTVEIPIKTLDGFTLREYLEQIIKIIFKK